LPRTVNEKSDVLPLITEVFRELGYEGASLGQIGERTRLGKGSLYHFFPRGKEQMAEEALALVDDWFVRNVYEPLETGDPPTAIAQMWRAVDVYFRSGQRVCLIGAFALDATRDRFGEPIRVYFERWVRALESVLIRSGAEPATAATLAEEVVLGIQGALVLARALHDDTVFSRAIERLRKLVAEGAPQEARL
jgi:AcrR family transcriptional regulator